MWSFLSGLGGGANGAGAARHNLPSSPPPVPIAGGDQGSVVVNENNLPHHHHHHHEGGGTGGFRVSLPTHGTFPPACPENDSARCKTKGLWLSSVEAVFFRFQCFAFFSSQRSKKKKNERSKRLPLDRFFLSFSHFLSSR